MIGAAFLGFLAGSGLWLTALILYALYSIYLTALETIGRAYFTYKQRHPKPPSILHQLAILVLMFLTTFFTIILLGHFHIIT